MYIKPIYEQLYIFVYIYIHTHVYKIWTSIYSHIFYYDNSGILQGFYTEGLFHQRSSHKVIATQLLKEQGDVTNLFLLSEDGEWGWSERGYSHFPIGLSCSTKLMYAYTHKLEELRYLRHQNFHLSHNIIIPDSTERR